MGFFSKKPQKSVVELLTEKSTNVVNVFTRTVTELQEINTDIGESVDEMNEAKKKLEGDMESLNKVRQSNEKVIFNIQKIME